MTLLPPRRRNAPDPAPRRPRRLLDLVGRLGAGGAPCRPEAVGPMYRRCCRSPGQIVDPFQPSRWPARPGPGGTAPALPWPPSTETTRSASGRGRDGRSFLPLPPPSRVIVPPRAGSARRTTRRCWASPLFAAASGGTGSFAIEHEPGLFSCSLWPGQLRPEHFRSPSWTTSSEGGFWTEPEATVHGGLATTCAGRARLLMVLPRADGNPVRVSRLERAAYTPSGCAQAPAAEWSA